MSEKTVWERQAVGNYLSTKFKARSGKGYWRVKRHQNMEGLKCQADDFVLCPVTDKEP